MFNQHPFFRCAALESLHATSTLNQPPRQLVLHIDIANVTAVAVNSAFCEFLHTFLQHNVKSASLFFRFKGQNKTFRSYELVSKCAF